MAMGRGSCTKVALIALLVMIWSPFQTYAANHIVGDSQGWGFSVTYTDWAKGQNFASGDTLVFNYQPGLHNVVPVNAAGYKNCKTSGASQAATSGNDKFTLNKGVNYYICSLPGHCSAGMKLQVVAQ
ncbi:hypothetical protein J5N97_028825 [Dioscorea zingiberensis]|uniref:Plantacyanin n=1 Tax=Dioscorea zingiberensis TaxID=325984 RepID=A0A9D5BZR4_9LILI|nr:hypothetical protein J5N97_028825 [Dioscorea zingiberensis]